MKCLYSLNDLKNLNQNELIFELSRHGHPKYRIINKKARNVFQMKLEVYEHYKNSHEDFLI